ncbi:MAG: hypothetical protein P8J68_06295 [Arenicellaceae bacterium]|nr:hypothetical protein [Arenicellaceae bacterium]
METWTLNKNMKLIAILCLTLASPFHLVMAQNFPIPVISMGSGEVVAIHPALCGMLDDMSPPMPIPIICAKHLGSGQTKGYLGAYGKWCVTTMGSEAQTRADCAFQCGDMNLNNTSLELPMSVRQRLVELQPALSFLEQRLGEANSADQADRTLIILDEWLVDEYSMGGDEDNLMLEFIEKFRLSVHACRLHECEDVAECQIVADKAFMHILNMGIELDIDMEAFDNLEDARQLALLLGSPP